jgi:hypothetical protein
MPEQKPELNAAKGRSVVLISHAAALTLAADTPSLNMLLSAAGTGKSVVLREVVETIGAERCAIVGTTGVAAFNVGGETIHSLLNLPIGSDQKMQGLPVERLQKLQPLLKPIQCYAMKCRCCHKKNWLGLISVCARSRVRTTPLAASL